MIIFIYMLALPLFACMLSQPYLIELPCLPPFFLSMKNRSAGSCNIAWLLGEVVDIKDLHHPVHVSVLEEKPVSVHQQQAITTVGTRWNPTQEQIDILEALYARGLRTPNAEEIQHITSNLRQYGRIEGKNVFYWFQNHKARERQKQKRYSASLALGSPLHAFYHVKSDREEEYIDGQRKRRCRSRRNAEINQINKEGGKERSTLVLFPLHPEGW